jgi:hypothetical protein
MNSNETNKFVAYMEGEHAKMIVVTETRSMRPRYGSGFRVTSTGTPGSWR